MKKNLEGIPKKAYREFAKLKTKVLMWVVRVATCLGVPSDKLLHFACAMLCMIVVSWLTNDCFGLIVSLAVSIGKELYDKLSGRGYAEWGDLIADVIGIAIGWFIVAIV